MKTLPLRKTSLLALALLAFSLLSFLAPPAAPAALPPDRYDAENRLIERHTMIDGKTSRIRFVYDADGNRVGKSVEQTDPNSGTTSARSTRYLVDENNPTGYSQTAAELDGRTASRGFLQGLRPVAEIALVSPETAPFASYLVSDGQGSTRASVPASPSQAGDPGGGGGGGGAGDGPMVVAVYDAFGNLLQLFSRLSSSAPWVTVDPAASPLALPDHLFAGERFDRDLGMLALRARDYAPSLGVFTTADTYEGTLRDPLSLHRYLYCNGDPLNRIDPTGHSSVMDVTASMATRVALFAMSTRPAATAVKFGLAALTLAAAIHDPGNFVSAFESPGVAVNLLAMDVEFVAYYGRRTADFIGGYGALRWSIRPKVETVLADAAQRVQQLDSAAVVGYRGSVARGYKGPHKNSDPFNPEAFDVDAFIVSDRLAEGVPKVRGARFPTDETSSRLVQEQEVVDEALRDTLPGLKKAPFSFRLYTSEEFRRKQNDTRVLVDHE